MAQKMFSELNLIQRQKEIQLLLGSHRPLLRKVCLSEGERLPFLAMRAWRTLKYKPVQEHTSDINVASTRSKVEF